MLINIGDAWNTARKAHNRYLGQVIDKGIRSLNQSPIQKRATLFLKFLKAHLTAEHARSLQPAIDYHEKLRRKMSRHEYATLDALLRKIFDYDSFTAKRKKRWSAYKLCNTLAYRVCPYCHYAHMLVTEEGKKSIRPDLDHYYPQHRYPYLALSLQNLIPSCSVCNSRLKGGEDMGTKPYLHPLKDAESLHFRCEKPGRSIVDIVSDFENIKDQLDVVIIHSATCAKSQNTLELFQLRQRYAEFSTQAADFVGSKTSIDNLDELFSAMALGPLPQNCVFPSPSKEREIRQLRFDRDRYKHYVHGKMFADLYDQFDRKALLTRPYP